MRSLLALTLFASLLAWAIAHLLIVARLFRRHGAQRAVASLFIPPLAPLYAADAGDTRHALAWLGAVVVYALALIFA